MKNLLWPLAFAAILGSLPAEARSVCGPEPIDELVKTDFENTRWTFYGEAGAVLAAKVTLAANEGRIQLVLRNPTDTAVPERVAMVGRAAWYGEARPAPAAPAPRAKAAPVAAPAPAPAPPVVVEKVEPPSTVIVIRADRVTSVTVPDRKAESVNQ
jgi:hypothetical protein